MVRNVLLCTILFGAGLCFSAETFQPADVKIVGDLDYGQTSDPVEYTDSPRYRAFVFTANSQDRIEVTVKGDDRKAFVAIADGGMKELASGTTHLTVTLPKTGPDPEAYYIIFRDTDNKEAHFTVELKKVENRIASIELQ
jgi:hypothetical protein